MSGEYQISPVDTLMAHADKLCYAEELMGQDNGAKFNIFRVLRIQRFETRTHTPLLCELLDPTGSHGQSNAFLKLFLEECDIPAFESDHAKVRQEVHVGRVTEDTGGRMDILISSNSGDYSVCIENKIDAADQKNQILRYLNHIKKGIILYLTLEDREIDQTNLPERADVKIRNITYQKHIARWLEACRSHAVTSPLVRETITQYLHLIQELTNQQQNQPMSLQIADKATNSPEELKAFFAICRAREEVEKKILEWLNGKLDELARNHHLTCKDRITTLRKPYQGFSFTNSLLDKNNLSIRFEFQYGNGNGLIFGFSYQNPKTPVKYAPEIQLFFEQSYVVCKKTDHWPAYSYWSKYENWNDETLQKIRFGNEFVKDLEERIKMLSQIAITIFSENTPT